MAECVTIVGSVFHVVALCATVVEMAAEMKCGSHALPKIREEVKNLQQYTVKSTVKVLHPGMGAQRLCNSEESEKRER